MAIQSESGIVTGILREAGLSYVVEPGRKHIKITWFANDQQHVYLCAKTPSDWRALMNCRARIRRMLRQQAHAHAEAATA